MSKQRSRLSSAHRAHASAIAVRLVAFLVAALSVVSIPAILFAASTGHLTSQATLIIVGGAALLVLFATLAAQSVDPLRR